MISINNTLFLLFLFLLELVYFRIADKFNIIDKPNSRSSHSKVTIRGGGIIFPLSVVLFYCFYGFQFSYFIVGLVAISIVSFLDDIHTLNNKIRLSVHFISVLLLFYEWHLYSFPWYWLLIAGIFVIGTINAYNFMDGVNGITGSYSFLAVFTLGYINSYIINFTSTHLISIVLLALVTFNIFNFRIKAKCFAGDVGSISIAFIIIFLIGQLVLMTGNFAYILLMLVYGLDTATTIFFRKVRKEDIFKAHRSHFYQYLANQLKWPHLSVSSLYFSIQLLINALLIYYVKDSVLNAIVMFTFFAIVFVVIRFSVEGKKHLLQDNSSF